MRLGLLPVAVNHHDTDDANPHGTGRPGTVTAVTVRYESVTGTPAAAFVCALNRAAPGSVCNPQCLGGAAVAARRPGAGSAALA